MLGYTEAEIPNHFQEWKQRLHPDDSDACGERSYRVLTTFRQYFEGQLSTYEQEYCLQHHNGNYLWVLCRGILLRDVGNKPYRMAGCHTDITRRKQAEEELQCYPQPVNAVQVAIEKFELGFVSNDLPQLLNSIRFGSERIRNIVSSLRNSSRLDKAEIKPVDIHEGIENTLLILQHRLQSNSHKAKFDIT
ncbi:response regulator receiver sensor signal transduction histidine kinase [Dolichospermum compactum NIES-806]|uniref:histidine kinase n=1 Tax=Dolichospermum compactum NIES-806 TaxID=1973481 RepID=A0A1Z4V940_9CYAN|nr:response regulator receiver sensor signal transduction histidine kinase [Dolichospermum compactum NIES-806]